MRALLMSTMVLAMAAPLKAQSPPLREVQPDEVLVVVNDSSAISQAVGAYYAAARSIPETFHLPVGTPTSETISRATYNTQIRDVFVDFFTSQRPDLRDKILFIVLTKGVPIRISNSGGSGTGISAASVDSELTQLFTGRVGDSGQQGRVLNPYHATYDMPGEFMHPDISYLVFRLDGYQTDVDPDTGVPADIQRLIDDALDPADAGQVLLDARAGSGQGDNWMLEAAEVLGAMGMPYTLDNTNTFQRNHPDLVGYCSWGSNDPGDAGPPYYGEVPVGSGNFYPGSFLPGALTSTYVSTSARTFLDGNQNYGQSLIVDLVDIGAAAANGHVYEPYLDAVARPQYLFPHYFQGLQLGTSYYQSIPYLSWENIVLGDPLQKSDFVHTVAPEVDSVGVTEAHAGDVLSSWNVFGEHFTGASDMTVRVGGVDCPQLVVANPQVAQATSPVLVPGIHDVEVETFMGSAVLEDALLVRPALGLSGTVDLGQSVTLTVYGKFLQRFQLFWSLGHEERPFPPFGTLCLDFDAGFYLLLSGVIVGDRQDLVGTIPDNPILHGVDVYFQSFVGSGQDILLTNCIELAIP